MQTGTSNLTRAVTGDEVTWYPQVYADWAQDGYGDVDSIDDLSGQADGYTVAQSYNDGLPDEIAFLRDSGVPGASVGLTGREELNAVQYFSPFRSDSPVFGFARDVAPVKIDQGVLGAGGIETVRIYTGQMADIPITAAGQATLRTGSPARLLLSQLVQPPIRERYYSNGPFDFGLTASWPISYALHSCAVYPSPPASTGCRLWLPMHGGGNPFIPSANPYANNFTGVLYGQTRLSTESDRSNRPLRNIRGPFVGSVDAGMSTAEIRVAIGSPAELGSGDDWMSTASSTGSVQFWVRGDAGNVNTTPGGSAQMTWSAASKAFIAGFTSLHTGSVELVCGVDVNRAVFVKVFDGTNTATFVSTLTLPQDGAWHFVGVAWSVSGNLLTCRLDSTTQTNTPSPALSTALLPASNDGEASTLFAFALPPAEVQFCTGAASAPATVGWLNSTGYYTRRAYVYPSSLDLEVLMEKEPREAWEYIGSLAQSEPAAVRIDENDDVYVMPPGWFATAALDAVVDTITSARHAARPNVALDHTKIRNNVRVSYQNTRVDVLADQILAYKTFQTILPGTSLLQLVFDITALRVDARSSLVNGVAASSFVHLTANQINGTDLSPPGGSYVTLNDSPDGSGTYSTQADVLVDTVEWHVDGMLVSFRNLTNTTWYLVNNSSDAGLDFSFIGVFGVPIRQVEASVTESEGNSVETRGLRTLTLRLPVIQSEATATQVARRLVLEAAEPLATVQVEVFGDPRRQPTDLVTYDDSAETGVSGVFRVQSVRHSISGPAYTQTVGMRQARTVGTWGDGVSRWGESRYAGQEVTVT